MSLEFKDLIDESCKENDLVLKFTIPGDPFGKQRTYSVGKRVIKRSKTSLYERKGREIWMHKIAPFDRQNPVRLRLIAYKPIPKTWPKWKKQAALSHLIYPAVKPDLDNVEKMIMDTLNPQKMGKKTIPNTGVYKDDSQVVDLAIKSWYDLNPRVEIELKFLPKLDKEKIKLYLKEQKK